MAVVKGLEAEIKRVVRAPMSAEAYGNAGFPVLGTPALIGLLEIDGRRLVFELDASDAVRPIAKGEMERFLVDIPRFLAKTVRSG